MTRAKPQTLDTIKQYATKRGGVVREERERPYIDLNREKHDTIKHPNASLYMKLGLRNKKGEENGKRIGIHIERISSIKTFSSNR